MTGPIEQFSQFADPFVPYHIAVDDGPQPVDVHVLKEFLRVLDWRLLCAQVVNNILEMRTRK